MGAAAAPALLSLAGAGLTAYTMSRAMKQNNSNSYNQLAALSAANSQQAIDTLPEAPEAPTNNADDAGTNAAEAERQKQQQAMAANDAANNPTGSLGLSTPANTKKKTLGGGL